MRFSNQLPVMLGGQPGQKRGFAGDRRPEIPPPLLVVGLRRRGIELAERVVVVVELPPMVGQDRRDLRPLAAVDERPGAAHQVKIQAAQVLPFGLRLQEPRAAARLGRLQIQRAVAQHRPVDPGDGGDQPAVLGGQAGVDQRHHDLPPRARAATAAASRAASAGSRTTMPSARQRLASAAVGGAVTPKMPMRVPAGVDQAIGGEQALAVPAIEVGRDDGDLERRGHLLQQRDADRQIALARREGVDSAARDPGGQQVGLPFGLGRGPLRAGTGRRRRRPASRRPRRAPARSRWPAAPDRPSGCTAQLQGAYFPCRFDE